jgi:DNA repair protein RecN (Recombination protein N)
MLVELSIRDLALIERAELSLGEGLSALTGETGGGKSLLVGALELLLGETPRGGAAQWLRKGAKQARVEGRFRIGDSELLERVAALLRRELPEIAESWEEEAGAAERELILGRSLAADGRTRAHVDQRPVTLRALRALAPLLLEIHGQNEHQRLLDPLEQLRLVDTFGGLEKQVRAYAEARREWQALVARLARLDAEQGERRDRLDLLRFQRRELDELQLREGEQAELEEERRLLRNAAELQRDLGGLVESLREIDGCTLDRLRDAENLVERWSELFAAAAASLEDLRSARIHVEEASAALASALQGVEDDPARLELAEERLSAIERLEHKYRVDEAGLLEMHASLEGEIASLESGEEDHDSLRAQIDAAERKLARAAKALASKRRALAEPLRAAVGKSLARLGLAKARFELSFEPIEAHEAEERYGPHGSERLELLLAANPGEPLLPLRHVVSGGESARIMLALRTVLCACDRGRTLVFDEIDAGVGGRLGPEVGRHLHELAAHHQVLCVTHLPAIAAQAHLHLHVAKEVRRGRTRTQVVPLAGESRVDEVADMIAGGSAHESARAEARRLLGIG